MGYVRSVTEQSFGVDRIVSSGGLMTETLSSLPTYPMARSSACPFDPPPELASLRTAEPVSQVRLWDGTTPWLVTGYENQRAILADPRFSADVRLDGYPHTTETSKARRRESRMFIVMDNPEHDVFRRMLTRDFMVKRVESLRPRIQEIVDGLIDDMLKAGPPTDLVQAFALPLPSLVICELLGVPYDDHDFFQRCSRTMVSTRSTVEQALGAADELRDYLGALVARKAEKPTDDLLGRLVSQHMASGALSHKEATDMAVLLLIAGHETTANMIALGTVALLQHPDQLAELRRGDDPALVGKTVEELLRYLTIVHFGRRRVALEDVEVGGHTIKAGDGVILANDAGNRDEAAFPDADKLDIHRDARHHIAFGYGIHQCLGQPLARVELQVVYGTLYKRIPSLALAIPFNDVNFKTDMIIYGVHSLPVTW
jgi:cytochrome P450